jgi:hypothetical protein
MKNLILTLVVLVAVQNTFAASSSVIDSCVAKTIKGEEIRLEHSGYTGDSHYIETANSADDIEEVAFNGSRFGGEAANPVLVLKQVKEGNFVSNKSNSEGYVVTASTSTRVATVESVKRFVADQYGIRKGMTLFFVCYTSLTTPR